MKHLKKLPILLMLLTVIIGSRTFAQDYLSSLNLIDQAKRSDRAKEVMLDNEYTSTGYEKGIFYCNPLLLNGKPINYNAFNVKSKGELMVIKGAAITGNTMQVPFYVYLRRDGNNVLIPGSERSSIGKTKMEISEILQHAKPGDQLIIVPVNRADGPAKRILKLLDGC